MEKLRKQSLTKDAAIREKDEKLEDMKARVARLTANNNDMLAILSTKVRLEESLKSTEMANRKLLQVTNLFDSPLYGRRAVLFSKNFTSK